MRFAAITAALTLCAAPALAQDTQDASRHDALWGKTIVQSGAPGDEVAPIEVTVDECQQGLMRVQQAMPESVPERADTITRERYQAVLASLDSARLAAQGRQAANCQVDIEAAWDALNRMRNDEQAGVQPQEVSSGQCANGISRVQQAMIDYQQRTDSVSQARLEQVSTQLNEAAQALEAGNAQVCQARVETAFDTARRLAGLDPQQAAGSANDRQSPTMQ